MSLLYGEQGKTPKSTSTSLLYGVDGYRAPQTSVEGGIDIQERGFKERRQVAPQPGPSALSQVGKAVGGFLDVIGRGTARVLPGGMADVEASSRAQSDAVDRYLKTLQQLRSPNLPLNQRNQLTELAKVLKKDAEEAGATNLQTVEKLREDVDSRKFAAATAELGLLAATGGVSRLAGVTKGAAGLRTGQLASRGTTAGTRLSQMTRPQLGRAAGVLGVEGAALGTAVGLQAEDPTLSSVAQSAALGGLLSGAIPLAGAGIGRGTKAIKASSTQADGKLSKIISSGLDTKLGTRLSNISSKFIDDTNMIKKKFGESINTTTGNKIRDEIESFITNIRQSDGLAQSRRTNNNAWQELNNTITNKEQYTEFGNFIKKKQNAINAGRLGKTVEIPIGTAQQEKAYRLLNQSTKDDIKYLFDNGKITQEQYAKWIDDPDYTRVQREVLDNQVQQSSAGGLIKKSSVTQQRLKGSTKEAIDPFASYVDWQRRVTKEVEQNNFAKYLRNQLDERGMTKIADIGKTDNTFAVFEDGIKQLYKTDPQVARQLQQLSDLELTAIADWALLPSRLLRSGATSMNVAFAVPNFIRDQMSSSIISKNALATHNPLAFWQGIKESMVKPIVNVGLKKIGKQWEPSPLFKEWLKRNKNSRSVDLARNLKTATRESMQEMGVQGQGILRTFEDIISATEVSTRYQNFLGTYKNAIKKGVNPEQALFEANQASRTNSINFSNRGEVSTFMKIFNPYFNAGVQGSKTLAKALKERPVSTSAKIGTTLLAPVSASVYYNLSDPERAAVYANIPEYERQNNLIMVLGSGRGYVKVPLPPGLKEFANPLRNIIESEYLGDRQGFLETAKNLIIDPFSPVGTTRNQLISNLVPQGAKPLVEIGMNRDLFTGREIIPSNMQGLPKEEQVFNTTPQIYRDIGGALNLSPLQLRKAITSITAGAGEGTLTTIDLLRGAETGGRSTPEQLFGRFYQPEVKGGGEVQTKFYNDFIPLRGRKDNNSKKITALIKEGKINEANELARKINSEIDEKIDKFTNTYGRFEQEPEGLLEIMRSIKFPMEGDSLSKKSIESRKKQ